jgi:hypothetical protein
MSTAPVGYVTSPSTITVLSSVFTDMTNVALKLYDNSQWSFINCVFNSSVTDIYQQPGGILTDPEYGANATVSIQDSTFQQLSAAIETEVAQIQVSFCRFVNTTIGCLYTGSFDSTGRQPQLLATGNSFEGSLVDRAIAAFALNGAIVTNNKCDHPTAIVTVQQCRGNCVEENNRCSGDTNQKEEIEELLDEGRKLRHKKKHQLHD